MQFWCSLKSLPNLLERVENISAVMIDTVSAFFWLDKYEDEYGKNLQRKIFKQLSTLLNDYNFILFATKSQIFQPKDRENPRDFMNPSWTELVQYRIYIWSVNTCCWRHGFDLGDDEPVRKEFCAKFISQSPKPPFKYILTESGVQFL